MEHDIDEDPVADDEENGQSRRTAIQPVRDADSVGDVHEQHGQNDHRAHENLQTGASVRRLF